MSGYVIGIDIGGTNIRVGLVDENVELIKKSTALTNSFQHADEMLNHIKNMIVIVDPLRAAKRIGFALPVPWHKEIDRIVDVTNIPFLEEFPINYIKDYFQEYEIFFDNDVNVVAVLESHHGASKVFKDSMYITVSTGIGSGIIYNKEIIHGAHGYAGEIGSMIISDREVDSALYPGTLESLCSGKTLVYKSQQLYGNSADAAILFKHYKENERKAVQVIEEWVEHFSSAIASLIQILDPNVLVMGGAVLHNNPWLIDRVKEGAKRKVFKHLRNRIQIVPSKFREDAGVIGAGYLAIKSTKEID